MLMAAKEAKEKAKSCISEETNIQLLEAEKSINEGVADGKEFCYCYKYLGKQAISKLEELGYRVQNLSDQRDGTMFKISW